MKDIKDIEKDINSIETEIKNYFDKYVLFINMKDHFFTFKNGSIYVYLGKKHICQIYYNQKEKEVKIVVGYAINTSNIDTIKNILNIINIDFYVGFYEKYDVLKELKNELAKTKTIINNQLIDLEFQKIEVGDIFVNDKYKIEVHSISSNSIEYFAHLLKTKRNKRQFLNILKFNNLKLSTYSSRKKKLRKI